MCWESISTILMCSSSLLDNLSENQSISNNNIPQKFSDIDELKKNLQKKSQKDFLSILYGVLSSHIINIIFKEYSYNKMQTRKSTETRGAAKKEEQNKKISNFLQYSRLYKSENPNANIINRVFCCCCCFWKRSGDRRPLTRIENKTRKSYQDRFPICMCTYLYAFYNTALLG